MMNLITHTQLKRAVTLIAIAGSFFLSFTLALGGCNGEPRFSKSIEVAGVSKDKRQVISAEELNEGYVLYMQHCYACHGEDGDGKGPASAYLRPQPRDFRTGVFKFGGVKSPGLPHNDELVRLVKRGLTGTAMLPWDLKDEEVNTIINYIKRFSDRWQKEEVLGERIEAPSIDPWQAADKGQQAAINRGEVVYHLNAQCRTCHPAYITQKRLYAMSLDAGWGYGEMAYRSRLRQSPAWKELKILPPDFLYANIRNVRGDDTPEDARKNLFKVIASGVQGAGMPTWKGAIPDEDIWALVYYVQELMSKRDTSAAYSLRDTLANQPKFIPPADAE